jgi:hypothetical protein
MRRFLVLSILTVALVVAQPGTLFAQSNNSFTSYYKPGNVAAGIEVGPSFGWGYFSIAAYPSLEFMVAKYRIGDVIPLDFGAEVKARVGLDIGYGGGLGLGVGGFGTAHFGFRGMPGDIGNIIGKFDFFLGLGLAFDFLSPSWATAGLGLASFGGFNYFLNDNLSVTVAENYWHNYYDTTFGLRLKFGSAEAAKKAM